MDISILMNKIIDLIINPLILLVFAIALLIFFFGIFKFIQHADDSKEREEGKKRIIYGLIGMFVMFSAYGLIHLILNTFGIQPPSNPKGL